MTRFPRTLWMIGSIVVILLGGCTLPAPSADITPTSEAVAPGTGGASIAGRLWHDLCASPPPGETQPETAPEGCVTDEATGAYLGNGRLDGDELGIEGVTVTLGEGPCPAFGFAETQTAPDGLYIFTGLSSGSYCIAIDPGGAENAALLLPGRWTYPPLQDAVGLNSMTVALEEGEVRSDVYFAWDYALQPPYQPVSTSTPTPEEPTEMTETPSPTPEDVGTPTITPTITPTYIEGDPRSYLGAPEWLDEFNNGQNWPLYSDDHVSFEVEEGELIMTAYTPDFYSGWMLTSVTAADQYLEAPMAVEACSGRDSYGLMFRATSSSLGYVGYLFGVSCDGHYTLRSWDGETMTRMVDWTPSVYIRPGSDQKHRIGAWAEGDLLRFYVDGTEIASVASGAYDEGLFGVYISSATTPNLTVAVDEYAYWTLP